MSIITKELAKQIAIKLTEKSRLAVDELKKEYQLLATELYEAQVPSEISSAFKKHPDWFYTRSSISVDGHGFTWEHISSPRPVICNGGTNANLTLNSKTSDKLTKAKRKHEKAREDYDKLKTETENALLALRTYARVKENFPLATPLLPPPLSNALVVNFDSLKKRLEKQTQVTTVLTKQEAKP